MGKFNEESHVAATTATSSTAETSGTAIPQMKIVPPKPKASKPQEKMPQKAAPASTPKPSAPPKASKPEHKQIVKQLPTVSNSYVPSATSSETKSSPTPMKTKVTVGRGTRPSPGKITKVPSASEGSDEYDDETLQAIIRNNHERVAQSSGSAIPLSMDPKVLLDYINIWYEDPNTPIDDLKLPPGISHIVATFINEAKWKETQAKQAKPKVKEPAEETAPAEEIPQESRADELGIEEITKETPADDSAPADVTAPADASKPADDSVPAEETASAEETARTHVSLPPEEKTSSPKYSKVKKMTPSTSDVKKTRAAEKEAKKRKGSSTEESTEAKRLKSLDENAPLDPVPLNIAPSYEMTPFESEDKEHLTDEEMKNAGV
ncbi:hypothetical protein ZWY2020_025505 [Hordeum vulgare]|nr:hypothetical protein ZWY2020_025505 [Hordeum vulgare]